MPVARFQMPDGRIARFEVPAGTTPEQAHAMMTAHFSKPQEADNSEPKQPTAMNRVDTVVSGLNRGAFTRMAGLPVDTVASALDLLKIGAGLAYKGVTGKLPSDLLLPYDRTKIPLTGDWIEQKIRDAGGSRMIDAPGPIDSTARVLHSVGMGAGGAIAGGRISGAPMTAGAAARNAGMGGLSGGAAAVAAENGASPELQILASMVPQALGTAAASATRAAVRGGEAGRQQMAQRVQDLKAAGIENPSLGLASGNAFLTGLENIASKVPGSVGLYSDHRANMIAGMMRKAAETRDLASGQYGTDVAGRAIQSDLQTLLKPRISNGFERANDQMVTNTPPGQRFPIGNSLAALSDATAVNPLAPNTTGSFVQPRIAALRQNMLTDSTETQPGMYNNQQVNVGLPVSAIREVRTGIGKEAASRAIAGTPEQAEYKQVYSGLSKDIGNAARTNDLTTGPQPNNRGPAERSFDRGNALYSAGMDRIAKVQPFASKDASEQAYNALMQSGKENLSTLRAVKKSVSEDTRATVAATAIDRMGKAKPGQQNEAGDVWSQETFLTNYNQLAPKARKELFSGFPNAEQVHAQVEALAKGSSMIRDSSRVWANPSGTGGNTLAAGTLGGIAANAFVNPMSSVGALAGLGGARLFSKNALLNPQFVEAMAKPRGQYNALLDLVPLTVNADQAKGR